MSSGAEAGGSIAGAVILPAVVAYGAGWLAWQSGKLIVEANRAVDRQIAEKKHQMEAAAKQRRMAAEAGHDQLVNTCRQLLEELENTSHNADAAAIVRLETMKGELRRIAGSPVPGDIIQLETQNVMGYIKLDSIVRNREQLSSVITANEVLYYGLSLADLMDDLRVAFGAFSIGAMSGQNVAAADPAVLERAELNGRLSDVAGRIEAALEFVQDIAVNYGMSAGNSAWFRSCFTGVDAQIRQLCLPTTNNDSLKKGIRRLEEMMQQYDMMLPSIEHRKNQMDALYTVYQQAAKALGEPVYAIRHFKSLQALEEQMHYLKKRSQRAAECAQLREKLGHTAYMCYAWDEELKAMGYSVRTRKKITDMVRINPEHAKLGQQALPFYQWTQEAMTQFYTVSPQCALQLIVHEDGTVSMQTLAEGSDTEGIRNTQRHHCQQLRQLHEKLRQNWFILYDYEETAPAEDMTTVAAWRASDRNVWRDSDRIIVDQRTQQSTSGGQAMKQK